MTKPLKNGHDKEAEPRVETLAARRSRRFKERKARGAVVLRAVVIEPDFVAQLAANGWLHESEARNAGAVEHALHALIMRALASGMSPNPAKDTLEVDVEAIQDALAWLPDGTPLDARSAAKAIGTAVKCAALIGFGPAEYTSQLRRMLAERGVAPRPQDSARQLMQPV
jgi:hypothetical protein